MECVNIKRSIILLLTFMLFSNLILFGDSDINFNKKDGVKIAIHQDNTPPRISNISITPPNWQLPGFPVRISCEVTDDVGVEIVGINIREPSGIIIENISMQNIPFTDIYHRNVTYWKVGEYKFYIWAMDTSGNWNRSKIYSFKVLEGPPPPSGEAIIYLGIASITWDMGVGTANVDLFSEKEINLSTMQNNVVIGVGFEWDVHFVSPVIIPRLSRFIIKLEENNTSIASDAFPHIGNDGKVRCVSQLLDIVIHTYKNETKILEATVIAQPFIFGKSQSDSCKIILNITHYSPP